MWDEVLDNDPSAARYAHVVVQSRGSETKQAGPEGPARFRSRTTQLHVNVQRGLLHHAAHATHSAHATRHAATAASACRLWLVGNKCLGGEEE